MNTAIDAWYLTIEGSTRGPLTSEQLNLAIEQGLVRPDTLVWRYGLAEWMPANTISPLTPNGAYLPIEQVPREAVPEAVLGPVLPLTEQKHETPDLDSEHPLVFATIAKPPRPTANFLWMHWNGEFSLGASYWILGVLLTLLLLVLVHALSAYINTLQISPTVAGLYLILLFVSLSFISIWQLVGVWRSAGHATTPQKSNFWPNAARLMMMLSSIRFATEFGTTIGPMLHESIRLVARGDGIAPPVLTLSDGGQGLIVSGGLAFGTTSKIVVIASAAPRLSYVRLESHGGLVAEGVQLYRFIRRSNLRTLTMEHCESACTVAFLGGVERLADPDAKLGFHSVSFGNISSKTAPGLDSEFRKIFIENKVPQWFIEKALGTVDGMWYPSMWDLRIANIITRTIQKSKSNLTGK